MIANKIKDSKIHYKADLYHKVDYQGMMDNEHDNSAYTSQYNYITHFVKPFFSTGGSPQPEQYTPTLNTNLAFFSKFIPTRSIRNTHFQLHYTMKAITEHDVLFVSSDSINLLNTVAGEEKKILDCSYSKFIDFDIESGLLLGNDKEKAVIYQTKSQEYVKNVKFYDNDDRIGRMKFFNNGFDNKVVVIANSVNNYIWDPITEKISNSFLSTHFTNDTDFNPSNNLFAMAMDDKDIELIDIREGSPGSTLLKGHKDHNFCIKFINDKVLASGGQDRTIRIWDLRMNKELAILNSNGYGFYTLEYAKTTNTIIALESYLNICCFSLDKGTWYKDSQILLGENCSVTKTPSEGSFYVGTHQVKPGMAKFNLQE